MSYFSELNRLEKERQFVKAVKLNEELLEHLASSLGWFLNQCEKNGNFLPNFDQMRQSVRKAQELMESLPTQLIVNGYLSTEKKHDKESTEDEAEPQIV